MKRRFRITLRKIVWGALALVVILVPLGMWGCKNTIVPPATLERPVTVYIFDYGRHASLVLPTEDVADDEHDIPYGTPYVEYTYGEWWWYAKNETGALDAFRALLISSQGALGRRELPYGTRAEMERYVVLAGLYELDVEFEAARDMLLRLSQEWHQYENTAVYNPRYNLHFVKHAEKYHVFNNCNPVLARWLRELDCEVRGWPLFSNWRIRLPQTNAEEYADG